MNSSTLPRLQWRLGLSMLLVVTVLMVAFSAVTLTKARQDRVVVAEQQIALALARLQTNLEGPLWNFDKEQIQRTLRS